MRSGFDPISSFQQRECTLRCSYISIYSIEEGIIYRREGNRSSLLLGGQNCFNSLPSQLFCTRTTEGQNGIILFFQSSWCKSSFSPNRPVAKQLAWQGIEAALSPKLQQRPLPSLLYKSFLGCMIMKEKGEREGGREEERDQRKGWGWEKG